MENHLSACVRGLLPGSFFLFAITGCGYQRPAGKWVSIETPAIYFAGVGFGDNAIDPNYPTICKEARDEIYASLVRKLPERIRPLTLNTTGSTDDPRTTAATLKLTITRCEVDVEQSGGSFTYYLSLPLRISFTQNDENLLTYDMDTYEQAHIDAPAPEFEFTFAEPVARTLLLFDGQRLWLPDN